MADTGAISCERLLWSWNQVTLADTGAGYGPIERSAGWPFKDRSDSTGGLGTRTRYLGAGAESLLATHAPPASLALSSIDEGSLLVRKEFLGEDAFGRNSRWLVYALLDPTGQLHPADALAAEAAGLLAAEVDKAGIPVRTDLPPLSLPMARPPVAQLNRHEQLLTRLLPGLLLVRDEPRLGSIVMWARTSQDVAELITSLIAVLPRAFSAALTFSTFDVKPARAGAELVGAVAPFSADPRQEPDQLWIDLVESATNLPPPAQEETSVAAELLDAARAGIRPPDDLATVAELTAWARARALNRTVFDATVHLQQGFSLDAPIDQALIDTVVAHGDQVAEPDQVLWLRQPGVAGRVAGSWSPMARTLARSTIRGDDAWYEQLGILLATHPDEIALLLDDLLGQQQIEDAGLLALVRALPITSLPAMFAILLAGQRVHAGFLLFDVLSDARLDDDQVRQSVLQPLLQEHWATLGPAANIPPAVVQSLIVRGPANTQESLRKKRSQDGDGAGERRRPAPPEGRSQEGLRRWLPGLR